MCHIWREKEVCRGWYADFNSLADKKHLSEKYRCTFWPVMAMGMIYKHKFHIIKYIIIPINSLRFSNPFVFLASVSLSG